MVKSGKVSVWVGDITSEDALLTYVDDGPFETDFNLQPGYQARRELFAADSSLPIAKLLDGFSSWELFHDPLLKRATDIGVMSAKCMVVFYAFEYVPSGTSNLNAPLKFIGTFDFGGR